MMKKQRKTPPIEDDTSLFPCDIIQNILSRLPLKSLLRFKVVCKPWKATIDDPGFAKMHSNQLNIPNSQSFCAVGLSGVDTYKLIKFQGQEPYVVSEVKFPYREFDNFNFLCCCEAILLFKRYSDKPNFVLWNPFTGNYSIFSCPYDDLIYRKPSMSYGLCFDKYQDDYKVIVHDVLRGGKYLVYSVKNDSWTERRSKFIGSVDLEGTYVDGFVYWTMSDHVRSCYHTIIYFDPKDNSLRKLRKPTDSVPKSCQIFLTNMSGNLCFYALDGGEVYKIWSLKESGGRKCWMRLMTAVKSESPGSCCNRPICLTSKHQILFYDEDSSSFTYCLEKQKFGKLEKFPALREIIVFACLESLNFPVLPRE